MKVPDRDEEVTAWSHSITTQVVLLQGPPDQHGGLGVQPHSFTNHPGGIGQSTHLL